LYRRIRPLQEIPLAKPNYRHAKKQKETARKARQEAKQQRRATVLEAPLVAETPIEPTVPAKPDGT
jgi:hypothetical protein